MAKIGYAYEKHPRDLPAAEATLREAGADAVWMDSGKARDDLHAMTEPGSPALRKGDVLLIRNKHQLGRLSARTREYVRRVGATIEVLSAPASAADRPPSRMGRPPVVDPDWPQALRLTDLLSGPGDTKHIAAEASKILGKPVKWHHVYDWSLSKRRQKQAAECAEKTPAE